MVFNGFPGNSMKAFQQGILKVVEKNEDYGNIGIDPRLFRAFEVTSVPTFVVVSSDFDVCDGFDCKTVVPPFDRMSGNVTLEHVLETFTQGRGPGSPISAQALGRLKRGSDDGSAVGLDQDRGCGTGVGPCVGARIWADGANHYAAGREC